MTNYWLMKSEPDAYSWQQLKKDKTTQWDGVRNYQAANNMKAMKVGDLAFFYHSNESRAIQGIMRIVKEAHPDPSDETGRFVMVKAEYVQDAPYQLNLTEIKAHPDLQELPLIRQSRLSVSPIGPKAWKIIYDLCRFS